MDGITLLRSLHNPEKYSRIIIVGHSLGSIIGYDLIRHLWSEFNTKYKDQKDNKTLIDFESKYATIDPVAFNVDDYLKDQEKLRKQQNNDGNPWLISHFITIGSPLTYASFLLAKNEQELAQRILERELPSSPPVWEMLDGKRRFTYTPDLKSTRRVLHHASPFACTQWINAYFKNDFVGGSLTKSFGPGIKEHKISLRYSFLLRFVPFLSHTYYWASSEKGKKRSESSTRIIREVMGFGSLNEPEKVLGNDIGKS
jgi:hypothetical protein